MIDPVLLVGDGHTYEREAIEVTRVAFKVLRMEALGQRWAFKPLLLFQVLPWIIFTVAPWKNAVSSNQRNDQPNCWIDLKLLSYDQTWLQSHDTSPLTNVVVSVKTLVANHAVRKMAAEWRENSSRPPSYPPVGKWNINEICCHFPVVGCATSALLRQEQCDRKENDYGNYLFPQQEK